MANSNKQDDRIIYRKTRHRNEDDYLDQLYMLIRRAQMGLPSYLITQKERVNYNRNCRYHKVENVFNRDSFANNKVTVTIGNITR